MKPLIIGSEIPRYMLLMMSTCKDTESLEGDKNKMKVFVNDYRSITDFENPREILMIEGETLIVRVGKSEFELESERGMLSIRERTGQTIITQAAGAVNKIFLTGVNKKS